MVFAPSVPSVVGIGADKGLRAVEAEHLLNDASRLPGFKNVDVIGSRASSRRAMLPGRQPDKAIKARRSDFIQIGLIIGRINSDGTEGGRFDLTVDGKSLTAADGGFAFEIARQFNGTQGRVLDDAPIQAVRALNQMQQYSLISVRVDEGNAIALTATYIKIAGAVYVESRISGGVDVAESDGNDAIILSVEVGECGGLSRIIGGGIAKSDESARSGAVEVDAVYVLRRRKFLDGAAGASG